MSAEFHSSNPFRRKPTTDPSSSESDISRSRVASVQPQSSPSTKSTSTIESLPAQAKSIKKVRVLSPPPSSPEGESLPQELPLPIPPDERRLETEDPFEHPTSDVSNDSGEETETIKKVSAPINPFQRTLATLENTDEKPPNVPLSKSTSARPANGTGAGRASLDVEAFKRLLMTGSANMTPHAAVTTPPATAVHILSHDGGGSTDVSSPASRQSIFDTISELHPESPRTSHEVSEPDDERRKYTFDGLAPFEKRKPPPPSSRHGKLIKVELKDETSHTLHTEYISSLRGPQLSLPSPVSILSNRSPTDLNKPLPEAPSRVSQESDRESVFDKESAGKIPEPSSPSSLLKYKTPPPPPLSRRHSQLVSNSQTSRTTPGKLPSSVNEGKVELENVTPVAVQASSTKPPPPPPTRRPASIRNPSTQDSISLGLLQLQEPEVFASPSNFAPAPPPSRKPSVRHSGRPASVLSMDLTNKRASTAPPPPPPPRQRASSRTSTEGPVLSTASSRRTSSDFYRKSSESTRGDPPAIRPSQSDSLGSTHDASSILADLTALQKEVDAFRIQYGTRDVT